MLWNFNTDTQEYVYGIPDSCLDYCIRCASDKEQEETCQFRFDHGQGVTNSSLCQNPPGTADSSHTEKEEGGDSLLFKAVGYSAALLCLVLIGCLVVLLVIVIKRKTSVIVYDELLQDLSDEEVDDKIEVFVE